MTKEMHCPECGCIIDRDLYSADKARQRFFAALHDAWQSMPDDVQRRFGNVETLRKHALIAIGHCDVMTIVVGSKTGAENVAHAFRSDDRYCIVDVSAGVIMRYKARSMSRPILVGKAFHEVAHKVADWINEQTGIDMDQREAA